MEVNGTDAEENVELNSAGFITNNCSGSEPVRLFASGLVTESVKCTAVAAAGLLNTPQSMCKGMPGVTAIGGFMASVIRNDDAPVVQHFV